jgi:hypothetical protein
MTARALWTGLACALGLVAPRSAFAYAMVEVRSTDDPGEGFNDATPVAPVGGNLGRTLGQQRMYAVQQAANLWGAALDSDVRIIIDAAFDDLGCTESGSLVLAFASTTGLEDGIQGDGADPLVYYPEALADRLSGSDLLPGEPDIQATFNSSVDAGCIPGSQWYYGFDANHGADQDLVLTALHEIGHGLGVQVFVDPDTGSFSAGGASAFSTHVLDLSTGKHWDEMSDAERAASYANVRNVVWDGARLQAAAAELLLPGSPVVQAPGVAGLSGLAGDAPFGAPITSSVSAQLVTDPSGCPMTGIAGRIVLLRDSCAYSVWASFVEQAGAVGVLLAWPSVDWSSPPPSIEEVAPDAVHIPVLSVGAADADLLASAAQGGAVTVSLSLGPGLRGSDAQGRVFLNATDPPNATSAMSHWDELARPNLLMEPLQKPDEAHDLDLTPALLQDLGWVPFCGNDRLDQDEECDDGAGNDDVAADACRSNCRRAGCGDGVVDQDEECDDGEDNSDTRASACRSDCREAYCGDGVRDPGEACDLGDANDNAAANACRTDCTPARCGDGVMDRGEACDDGADNSDTRANACRSDCSAARCGDGIVDRGEACDSGANNSNMRADACRSDCRSARCGDGVVDRGETCDDGADNSDLRADACRVDCSAARCGDGVVDQGERCDRGDASDCASECAQADAGPGDAGSAGAGAAANDASSGADSGGCGCRVAGGSAQDRRALFMALALCAWLCTRRLRSRSFLA